MDKPTKKITTLDGLEEFVHALITAHGDMISTTEASLAIQLAFKEYRESLEVTDSTENYNQAHKPWSIDES